MSADRAARIHLKPLINTGAVKEVAAGSDARRTGNLLLTDRTHRPHRDSDMRLDCRDNLLARWNNRDGVEEGSAQIHGDGDIHDHGRPARLPLKGVEDAIGQGRVAKMHCEDIVPCRTLEKSNDLEKGTVSCQDVLKDVKNGCLVVLKTHMSSCGGVRKSLSLLYK
jgi:hypothetical protein